MFNGVLGDMSSQHQFCLPERGFRKVAPYGVLQPLACAVDGTEVCSTFLPAGVFVAGVVWDYT